MKVSPRGGTGKDAMNPEEALTEDGNLVGITGGDLFPGEILIEMVKRPEDLPDLAECIEQASLKARRRRAVRCWVKDDMHYWEHEPSGWVRLTLPHEETRIKAIRACGIPYSSKPVQAL
jgi:hypothetical protein